MGREWSLGATSFSAVDVRMLSNMSLEAICLNSSSD